MFDVEEPPPMSTTETPPVPPPFVSSRDSPQQIPGVVEREKNSCTKINLNPLSMLRGPPKNRHVDECLSDTHVKNAMSLLVFQLTSVAAYGDVESMVDWSNTSFSILDNLKADYTTFYEDVRSFIVQHWQFKTAERHKNKHDPSKRYEDAKCCEDDIQEEIRGIEACLQAAKEKESLNRQMEEAMEVIVRHMQEVKAIEQDEKVLETKKHKCAAEHATAKADMQKLVAQREEANKKIERLMCAAIQGIDAAECRLQSN